MKDQELIEKSLELWKRGREMFERVGEISEMNKFYMDGWFGAIEWVLEFEEGKEKCPILK